MCLLVGPSCSGKTLLLKRLQNGNFSDIKDDVPATIATVGTNLVTVPTLKKAEVTIREMGGAMGPIWNKYYKDATSLLFMCDASKQTQMAITCVQLITLLSHPRTQNLPVLILLNKIQETKEAPVLGIMWSSVDKMESNWSPNHFVVCLPQDDVLEMSGLSDLLPNTTDISLNTAMIFEALDSSYEKNSASASELDKQRSNEPNSVVDSSDMRIPTCLKSGDFVLVKVHSEKLSVCHYAAEVTCIDGEKQVWGRFMEKVPNRQCTWRWPAVKKLVDYVIPQEDIVRQLRNIRVSFSNRTMLFELRDVPNGMSRSELESVLRLEEVIQHAYQHITVIEISAKTGSNLEKVIKWIYQHDKPNVDSGS